MSRYICEIEGIYLEVKKTGREAYNRFNTIGPLIEVISVSSTSGAVIGPTNTSRQKPYWVPASELFEIGGEE